METKTAPHKYTATEIGAWFLRQPDRESGESITHLKLQKLVYYAQAWSLVLGKELFDEELEAWAHGPVSVSIWNQLSGAGWNALGPDALGDNPNLDPEVEEILQQVQGAYGGMQAKDLENMTHQEVPWIEARNGLPPEARSNNHISKETMKNFYQSLLDSVDGDQASH